MRLETSRAAALAASVAGAGVLAAASPAAADAVADFYKGKTVTILVGYGAGGGYDTTTRLVARHLGKHIPGNPSIIVQNMPGSGTLRLANFLYNAAPKDGLTLGVFSTTIALEPLFGNKSAQLEAAKFGWIGSMHNDINSCGVWKGAGIGLKTFDDLLKAKKTIVFGTTSMETETGRYPVFIRSVFKAPIKVVAGYKGTKDINLAMQNGEAHASCGMYESSVRGAYMSDVQSGDLKIIFQAGLDRKVSLFGDAPSIGELIKPMGNEMRQIAEIIFRPGEITRPLAAPPGTPADRVKALRKALRDAMKDPATVADGKKIGLDFLPMEGERVEQIVADFYKTPPEVIKKALALSSEPKK
jgi:tripartite-type tricarboxylate transporter receptor subunit TctC